MHLAARALVLAFGLTLFGFAMPASAFKLAPNGSPIERALVKKDQRALDRVAATMLRYGIDQIGEPVHEEITNLMFGCPGGQPICADPEYDSGLGYVLAGVRWNDDPPFEFGRGFGNYPGCLPGKVVRLVTFPECWARVFIDGQRRAARGERLGRHNAPLLVRSHFGDLQFLHAMAGRDGEPAIETHTKIMMWAEFTWKVATLKVASGDVVVEVPVAGMREVFSGHGWNVQDLFAQGNAHVRRPKYLAEFAFGSLLHLVQDAFSAAHVRRDKPVFGRTCGAGASSHAAPGRITQFYSYAKQDAKRHAAEDTREALMTHLLDMQPSVVDVGRVLVESFERRDDWEKVQDYLLCVFMLAPQVEDAGPGDGFVGHHPGTEAVATR